LGIGVYHQFGSPVTMYIDGGSNITLNGDANIAGQIFAVAIGQLVPM
jgi:hypothetical protein